MGKLIQICASENDLFALDEEGEVYQYDFRRKTWVKLASGPSKDKDEFPPERAHDGEGPPSTATFGR